jgi:predicted enzyme related to lactoylglutathione lyase
MSQSPKPEIGAITWTDITVENAKEIRDFYSEVVGWQSTPVNMAEYNDFSMNTPETGKTVSGICHARGVNADLPSQWLIYITVENIDKSSDHCVRLGGKILTGPKSMGDYGRFCVIQDPAGAVAALIEPAK